MIQIGELIVLLGLSVFTYAVFLLNFIAGIFTTGVIIITVGVFVTYVGLRTVGNGATKTVSKQDKNTEKKGLLNRNNSG